MTDYGYLNHTSIDERDDSAIEAIFGSVPVDHVVIEQNWTPGDTDRPSFDKMLSALQPGDTLYLSSIDRLGLDAEDSVRLWHIITEEKGAGLVVLDDPELDSRKEGRLTTQQLTALAQAAFKALAVSIAAVK